MTLDELIYEYERLRAVSLGNPAAIERLAAERSMMLIARGCEVKWQIAHEIAALSHGATPVDLKPGSPRTKSLLTGLYDAAPRWEIVWLPETGTLIGQPMVENDVWVWNAVDAEGNTVWTTELDQPFPTAARELVINGIRWWAVESPVHVGFAEEHIEELAASTVTYEHARRAGIWTEGDPVVLSAILGRPVRAGRHLVYPYRRPGVASPVHFKAKGAGGYGNPSETTMGVYYPPGVLDRGDLRSSKPLIITEGEKKALALDALGYAVIGLPGVNMAHDTKARNAGVWRLHPWIRDDVDIRDRLVIIAFDSNVHTNPNVRAAAKRTFGMFADAGARVRNVYWPPKYRHLNGLDDFAFARLEAERPDAVRRLLLSAPPTLFPLLIPATIAAMKISAAQKTVYGALAARASEGRVEGVPLRLIGLDIGASKQAVCDATKALHAAKLIERIPGASGLVPSSVEDEEDRWYREPNTYVLHHDPDAELIFIAPEDARVSDIGALVEGVLRAHEGEMKVEALAAACGITASYVRRTVKQKLQGRAVVVGDAVRLR